MNEQNLSNNEFKIENNNNNNQLNMNSENQNFGVENRLEQSLNFSTQNNGQINVQNNNFVDDEELLSSFVGEKYQKIKKNFFSVPAFLLSFLTANDTINLGGIYFFYRKMYVQGILLLVLNLLLNLFSKYNFTILIAVILGFMTNKIYLNNAKTEIENIKLEHKDTPKEELKKICINAGGTNMSQAILLGVVFYILVEVIKIVGVLQLIK